MRKLRVRRDLSWTTTLYSFLGLEAVVLYLKRLNKQSVEAVLRKFGAQIGQNCDIESGLTLHNAKVDFSKLSIGNLCHIGKDAFLDLRAPILIRERSTVSMRTIILTHMDLGHAGPFEERISGCEAAVEIGPGAYIGAGAIILPGIKVGEGSVVGAGALVHKDVAPRTVVAGVPIREIRRIIDQIDKNVG